MSKEAAKLLEEALDLPPAARATLAGSLIESLDETIDEDAEAAWQVESSKRLSEIDSGKVLLVPWAEARRRIFGK